eukprot:7252675-Prymnesium_polylepis.1
MPRLAKTNRRAGALPAVGRNHSRAPRPQPGKVRARHPRKSRVFWRALTGPGAPGTLQKFGGHSSCLRRIPA